MSVLIKGMEMPEKCSDCWMCQNSGGTYELGDDFCCIGEVEIKDSSVRQASCPLVSVLPHGRLIDADALLGHMRKIHDKWKMEGHDTPTTDDEIMTMYMPTIIEAEEEQE